MHPNKLKNVLALSSQDRYWYFVRKVADSQLVWGLQGEQNRWIICEPQTGIVVYPLWPEKEYAEASKTGSWADTYVSNIPIDTFLTKWLPKMHENNEKVGVFWDLNGLGVDIDPLVLAADLLEECENY